MSKVYLIAGLGADTRVYNNIDLNDHEVICLNWIEPNETDSLVTYSQKLINQYNISYHSIIIGNSLGGMIAVEMAKLIPIKNVILISSIKTVDEAPWYFGIFRAIPVYKIIPGKLMTSMGFLARFIFGKMNSVDSWLFNDMLKNSSPVFVKWAMGAVLKWDNTTIPPNICQINGDKDLIFNYRRIKDATIVKGGTHIMIFDRAKEINKWLRKIFKK